MACPFAPLLALLPGLPFLPWLMAKYARIVGKNKQAETQVFNFSFSNSKLASFEYYSKKAPHFRRNKALVCKILHQNEAEFLLFDKDSNIEYADKLGEILYKYGACGAVLKKDKLQIRVSENSHICTNAQVSSAGSEQRIKHIKSELEKLQI